jgi:phosphatidylserine/phosphatidylglycerophosphate/cardiolipin synthase-like enzyme
MHRFTLALASALAAALVAAPTAQATRFAWTQVGSKAASASFTEAKASPYDQTLINEAAGLVDQAVKDSWILVDLHKMDDNNAFEMALRRAAARNVHVAVVWGGDNPNLADFDTVNGDYSLVKSCHNCISAYTAGDGAEMHSKFITFSALDRNGDLVADKFDTVWISSANMTQSSGAEPYNNTVTMFGATELYNRLRTIWQDQWGATTWLDYYQPTATPPRGYFHTDATAGVDENTWGFFAPDTDPDGDMWKGRLDDIKTPGSGQNGAACDVRVMQEALDPSDLRAKVIDELVRLKTGQCVVKVIVGKKDDGTSNMGDGARQKLGCANIPMKKAKVHDKSMIYNASTTSGGAQVPTVITGSSNVTVPSLRHNDELMVRFYSTPTLHAQFQLHFDDAWNDPNSTTVTWNGGCP